MPRNLVRFDPFFGLDELRKQFDDGFFRSMRVRSLPATDVWTEDDNTLMVAAHLPDFAEHDISVDIDKGALVIQAEKHEREEDKKRKYVLRESSASFYRSIALPEQADDAHVTARFKDGVLTVTVPLKQLPVPTKVAITSGGE
ncbi:MAG TPA: Hsp20/alpha crystallin family protein [Candidatus Lumbricidophila sp.]|nr:Hsp20/alpha crystallin family protein [Candidatus Lumbricidophila sp.]